MTANAQSFHDLLTAYTTAVKNNDHCKDMLLMDVSTAVVYSVLKKLIDPQAKNTDGKNSVGFNKQINALRRSIYSDRLALDTIASVNADGDGRDYVYNQNGDRVYAVVDTQTAERYDDAINRFLSDTLSDSYDLIQTAALAILDEQKRADTSDLEWLEKPYDKRVLTKKVYIDTADVDREWKTVQTAPILEVFKAVRRYISDNRSLQVDPRCKYVYLSELATDDMTDAEITIYRRLPRYSQAVSVDMHVDRLGNVTMTAYSDDTTERVIQDFIVKGNLTAREQSVLMYRLKGHGRRTIANSLGVTDNSVNGTLQRLRKKALEFGLTPNDTDDTDDTD